MADHPLRPATDRCLGGPLPHQLANLISATPKAKGLTIPSFPPQGICGISVTFATLSPTSGHVPIYYSPVRHSPSGASTYAAVRLACVKHAASVQSEPGSNSSVQFLAILSPGFNTQTDLTQSEFTFVFPILCELLLLCLEFVKTIHLSKQYYFSSAHIPTLIDCFI